MSLSKPWLEVSRVECDENGKPKGEGSPLPFILSAVAMLLVAGLMRHIIATAGVDTIGKGFLTGGGIGLFMISPSIMINNAYPGRPFKLTLIDGGYATIGCAIIADILMLSEKKGGSRPDRNPPSTPRAPSAPHVSLKFGPTILAFEKDIRRIARPTQQGSTNNSI